MNLQYEKVCELAEKLGITKPEINDKTDLFWLEATHKLSEKLEDNYTPMKVIEMAMDKGKVITVESVGDLSIIKIGGTWVRLLKKRIE